MSGKPVKRKVSKTQRRELNEKSREEEVKEILALRKRVETEKPPSGYNPLAWEDESKYNEPERVIVDPNDPNYARQQAKNARKTQEGKEKKNDSDRLTQSNVGVKTSGLVSSLRKFAELPLSSKTQRGLEEAGFSHLTKIQRGSLPHSLAGRDILGSARTGSGKTLAYIIPCLERLYLNAWDPQKDGLGAILLSPTRELAIQIFDVLRIAGKHHNFSAGLVIGGKDVKTEMKLIGGMNILVATLGRLQQHMEQSYDFDATNLRILVLDEADRILEMGFADTLDAILENLPPPPQRQTLLFSATQTKEIRALAKLSLHQPEYIAVHEFDEKATPLKLSQHYMVLSAGEKMDALYSFIRTHLKHKTIVFASACKQVRYLYEAFRRTRPGIPLMHLHGRMNQMRRMEIYYDFCNRKEAVLFSTDVAARGLDFPDVDWVVQLDCPDTPETYIHRVGRTARYRSAGHAMMMLLPSEVGMIEKLRAKRVEIGRVKPDMRKMQSPKQMFAGFIAEDPDLKYLGQKAFISYIRSVHLQSDKEVFRVEEIDVAGLADSLGLPGLPQIKKLKESRSHIKNLPYAVRALMEQDEAKRRRKAKLAAGESIDSDDDVKVSSSGMTKRQQRTEVERLLARKNAGILDKSRLKLRAKDGIEDDEDDGFLTVKRTGAEFLKSKGDRDSDDEVTRWVRDEGLVQETDSDSDSDSDSDEQESQISKKSKRGDSKLDLKRKTRLTSTEILDEKEARKAAKKLARKKEIEARLRAAMLSNNLQVQSIDEAIREGLDDSFIKELQGMVKAVDPLSKARQHERVKEKHRKRRLMEKERKKGSESGVVLLRHSESNESDGDSENERGEEEKYSFSYFGSDDSDLNSETDEDETQRVFESVAGRRAKRVKQVEINLSEDSDSE